MTPQEQKILSRYEKKKAELHLEFEKEAQALAGILEQRDQAIHNTEVAKKEEGQIKIRVAGKSKELEFLESTIEQKKKEGAHANSVLTSQFMAQEEVEDAHKERVKAMKIICDGLRKKADSIKPKAKEHDRLEKENKDLVKHIENLSGVLAGQREKLETLKIANEKITENQDKEQKRLEVWFKSLQKFESKINFYAERIARWYQQRGLKLPAKYDPEEIKKLWRA